MEDPKKILIIEDNVMWAESYRKWIGQQYDLKLAFNKREALDVFQEFLPDLIILDLGLPQIKDGLNLLEDIIKKGLMPRLLWLLPLRIMSMLWTLSAAAPIPISQKERILKRNCLF